MDKLSKTARKDAKILGLMVDDREWTVAALASTLAMSAETVRRAVLRLIGKHKIYHSRTLILSRTHIYRIVKTEIAAWQGQATFGSEHKVRRVWCRARDVDRWSAADQALTSAMYAMVRTGSPSAGQARKGGESIEPSAADAMEPIRLRRKPDVSARQKHRAEK